MVVIEYASDFKKACWVDGLKPERRVVEELYQSKCERYHRDTAVQDIERRLRVWPDDRLMLELIELTRAREIKPAWKASIDDIFYMRPSNLIVREEKYGSLYAHRPKTENQRNRQMIIVYQGDFGEHITCTRTLIDSIGIKSSKKTDIQKYRQYEKAVLELLEFVTDHYAAPCMIAEWSLKQLGFCANPLEA